MRTLAVIPARGGSKGLPGKNLARLSGRSLLAWTVDAALGSGRMDRVVVSSDSTAILKEARRLGAEPLRRPPELATDMTPSEPVVEHVLDVLLRVEGWVPDVTVLLQPTSPLRGADDVDGSLALLEALGADAVISVYEPSHSPYKCFVADEDGYLRGLVDDRSPFLPRQSLPRALMPNGAIYVVRTEVFRAVGRFLGPNTVAYEMPAERSIDIDTSDDLRRAEQLLRPQMVS